MILAIVFLKMDTMGPHICTIYVFTHHPLLLQLLQKWVIGNVLLELLQKGVIGSVWYQSWQMRKSRHQEVLSHFPKLTQAYSSSGQKTFITFFLLSQIWSVPLRITTTDEHNIFISDRELSHPQNTPLLASEHLQFKNSSKFLRGEIPTSGSLTHGGALEW